LDFGSGLGQEMTENLVLGFGGGEVESMMETERLPDSGLVGVIPTGAARWTDQDLAERGSHCLDRHCLEGQVWTSEFSIILAVGRCCAGWRNNRRRLKIETVEDYFGSAGRVCRRCNLCYCLIKRAPLIYISAAIHPNMCVQIM
jgi:hypothetical protein